MINHFNVDLNYQTFLSGKWPNANNNNSVDIL